jgi:hypothetical protein
VNILRNNNITIRQLLDVISKDSQWWASLLLLTGGLLELIKCSYHVIHFDFKPDEAHYMQDHIPEKIEQKMYSNERVLP